MVSLGSITAIAVLVIGGIVFFSADGINRFKAFGDSLKVNGNGTTTGNIPSLQKNLATNQSSGVALANTNQTQISTGSIASKRNFTPVITQRLEVQRSLLPEVQKSSGIRNVNGTLIIGAPTPALTKKLTGLGTAQFSTGSVAIITEQRRAEIRARALTEVEQRDVIALEARRQKAIDRGINPNVKLSGAELVLRKREQEEISKQFLTDRFGGKTFVGGKLFANPDFESGGLTPALSAERANTQAQIQENLKRNAIEKARQIKEGKVLQTTVGTTAEQQKRFFLPKGIAIRGGNVLSPRALAKLKARGIF